MLTFSLGLREVINVDGLGFGPCQDFFPVYRPYVTEVVVVEESY
jgi:hypothetical protein